MTRYRFKGAAREGNFLGRHSLSLVLAGILLVQTVVAIFAGYHVWSGEQEVHGLPLEMGESWIWGSVDAPGPRARLARRRRVG